MAYEIGFVLGKVALLLVFAFAIVTLVKTRSLWNGGKMWKSFGIMTALLLLIQVGTTSVHLVQFVVVFVMLIATIMFNVKSKRINRVR